MKPSIARREFLFRTGKSLGFLGVGSVLFESVLGEFFSRAIAAQTGAALNPTGYYLHFSLPGGPPRWYFDLPLTPAGLTASNFVQGGFGTRLEKVAGAWESRYGVDAHKVGGKTIYLPPVWKMGVGGQNFASLLPNTLFVRGMDMEINNHSLSNARQTAPIIGGYSINGMVADGADRPMPGVVDTGANAAGAFRSKKRFAPNAIVYTDNATTNPVSSLLTPFKNYMNGRSVHSPAANALTAQAFAEFEKYAANRGIAANSVTAMYDGAMDLIEQNIFSLSTQWAATVAKYRALITTALHPSKGQLPGLFDQKVPCDTSGKFRYVRLTDGNMTLGDARDMITANTMAPKMAENFAVGELLLDKVTSNMVLSFPALSGLTSGKGNFNMTHDQHDHGAVMSTIGTTLFYRAFLSCLTEFTAELKTKGLFERTVIHISAEFNRTPKADKSGADHAFMGSNATLISGMIGAPAVVGNIQKASYDNTYQGTFGVATSYELGGLNRPIQVNDVARTITAMLGVDDIVTNGRALLAPTGGKWLARKEEAKNV
jgi:hypothetical protein